MLRSSCFVVVIGCLGATLARADNATVHATANGSFAATDNETGAETGARGRRGGLLSSVRPGLLVTYLSPRHIHELLSEVDFIHNLRAEKPNVTFRGDWKAFLIPGPRSEASLGAAVSLGQVNALRSSDSPVETPTQVLPLGRVETRQAVASEHASYVATEFSRISQRAFSRYTTTDDNNLDINTEAFEVGGALSVDRRLRRDNFVLEGGVSFLHLEKLDPMFVQDGNRMDRQINPRGVFIWQHDYNRNWSSSIDAGAVYVKPIWHDPYNPDEERKTAWFPIVGGVLAYTDVWGRAQLSLRRAVTPNLFIAQNTLSSSLNLTGAMPLAFLDKDSRRRAPKVVGLGTFGLESMEMIDSRTGSTNGHFAVVRVDGGIAWSVRPGQTLGIRYEISYQNGDTIGEMVVPSFLRNTLYFTYSLRYPEDVQVRVPRRTQSMRADRKDLMPIGAEPVIVDPEDLLEGGAGE